MTGTQILTDVKTSYDSLSLFFNDWQQLKMKIEDPAYSQVVVIVDENTEKYCLHILFENIDRQVKVITIPAGEEHKNLMTCTMVYEKMVQKNVDRSSLVVLLGGGVVCDLGAYCSATYMRGIPFISVPTSLLAQADAAAGGKSGVDVKGLKNIVGVFKEPESIHVFDIFLQTLPQRQVINGMAEVIKHWLIADGDTFYDICHDPADILVKPGVWVPSSLKTKLNITQKDPKEKNIRKILNFGHTIGHAVETAGLFTTNPLLHGEAIAIGMICESYISYRLNLLSEDENFMIRRFLISVFGHYPKVVQDPELLINIMQKDKKNRNGIIMFSLLKGIGNAVYNQEVPEEIIYESLYFYKEKW